MPDGAPSFGASLGDVRGGGFGLNYNQGFTGGRAAGSGGFMQTPGSLSQDLGKVGYQGYQNRQSIAAQGDVQKSLAGMNNAKDLQVAQIGADASKYPYELKQQRFDQMWPYLQGQLGGLGHAQYGYNGSGQVGAQPAINTNPIYSGNQVQQMVNTGRAQNDQKTAGQVQQMQGDLAGRGFGGNSPLAAALQASYQGQNTATNASQETQTRLGATQQNADHVLDAQKAAEGQFANRQQEDIARHQIYQNQFNALLGALGSLAG